MKKLETMKADFKAFNTETLKSVSNFFTDENRNAVSASVIKSVLLYEQLNRALSNNSYSLVFDYNYKYCKAKTIDETLFLMYTLVSNDNESKRILHYYAKSDFSVDIVTSADNDFLSALCDCRKTDALLKSLDFSFKKCVCVRVKYDDIVSVSKSLLAVYKYSDKQRKQKSK